MHKIKITIKALALKLIDRILVNDVYMAYYGSEMYFTLWNLDQYLRAITKYGSADGRKYNEKEQDFAQGIRDKLYKLMEDNGIDLDRVE